MILKLKRINMISGKGGVGRSTLSAVLAKSAAASGKRVLLAEFEDDHGSDSALARMFGKSHFEEEPEQVDKNLHAMRLSPLQGQTIFLNSFLKISALTNSILRNKGVQWFLEGAPAFKEMGYFYHLLVQIRKKEFDCLILDLPATGHLVGLARLPKILLRLIPIGPIAEKLKEGQAHLYNANETGAWIVTIPQTLPVSEAFELKDALQAETVNVAGFILNRAPFDPFTPAEEDEIKLLVDQQSELGSVGTALQRIRRFREAREKICAEMKKHSGMSAWVATEVSDPITDLISTAPLKEMSCE